MKEKNIYIAGITKILPTSYTPQEFMNYIYPKELAGERLHRMAQKISKNTGIKKRLAVMNFEKFPNLELADKSEHPESWGGKIVDHFSNILPKDKVGFFSTSYNITYHKEVLPNLASRIVINKGLNLDTMPLEYPYYGCASGIFILEQAIEYCKKNKRAAIVYVFDQCSHALKPIYDFNDKNFKPLLRSTNIFSDGAVGMLIIPEELKNEVDGPLMKIIDLNTAHKPGDAIKMEGEHFLTGNQVKDIMPPLVAESVIKPTLEKNCLDKGEIDEWAIHQGGIPVLESFCNDEILGLSDQQISRSRTLFEDYGNFSSPSCFMVLESFFNEAYDKKDKMGMVVGFGAGYYFGSLLYQWEKSA